MKKIYILFISIFVATLFVGCGESQTKKAQVVEVKQSSPEVVQSVNLTTLEGTTLELGFSNNILVSKDLNGKITLINFFATWCPPCIEEIPTFNKLYEQHSDIFEIVGVLYKDNISKEELLSFVKEHNIKFPVTMGDENNTAAKMFGDVSKIPESFLFSKEGFLFEKYVGIVNEQTLDTYLSENSK